MSKKVCEVCGKKPNYNITDYKVDNKYYEKGIHYYRCEEHKPEYLKNI